MNAELIPTMDFPSTWKRASCQRLTALGIDTDEIAAIEAKLMAFRRIRDEAAVERYQARLPDLRKEVAALRNQLSPLIAERRMILGLHGTARIHYAHRLKWLSDEIDRIGKLYQATDAELTGIEADYPRRLAHLKGV